MNWFACAHECMCSRARVRSCVCVFVCVSCVWVCGCTCACAYVHMTQHKQRRQRLKKKRQRGAKRVKAPKKGKEQTKSQEPIFSWLLHTRNMYSTAEKGQNKKEAKKTNKLKGQTVRGVPQWKGGKKICCTTKNKNCCSVINFRSARIRVCVIFLCWWYTLYIGYEKNNSIIVQMSILLYQLWEHARRMVWPPFFFGPKKRRPNHPHSCSSGC